MKSIIESFLYREPASGEVWEGTGGGLWVVRAGEGPRGNRLMMAVLPSGRYINLVREILTKYIRQATKEELDKYGLYFI